MKRDRWLWLLLIAGLLLRLLHGLGFDPALALRASGGDTLWYLANGLGFFTGQEFGVAYGITYTNSATSVPPVYLVFVGSLQLVLPPEAAVIAIRVVQAMLSTLTIFFVYRLTVALTQDLRAARLAGAGVAFNPAFIIEAANILTETLYIFLIAAACWLLADFVLARRDDARWPVSRIVLLVGALLGVATLTRAALLLFPLGVAGLVLLATTPRRRSLGWAALLLLAYGGVVSTWTIHNLALWNRFVIASDQFMPALWRGAVPEASTPEQADALLEGSSASEQVAQIVSGDPLGYLRTRISELARANLVAHGALLYGGDDIRTPLARWLSEDRSVSGLLAITQLEGFWGKLVAYLLHGLSLAGGLLGMLATRRRWRVALLPLGFIVYTLLIHLALLALPRYIFPTQVAWWAFAGAGLIWLYDQTRTRLLRFRPARAGSS